MQTNYAFLSIIFLFLSSNLAFAQKPELPEQYTFSKSIDFLGEMKSEERGNITLKMKFYYDKEIALLRPISRHEQEGEEERTKTFDREAEIIDLKRGLHLHIVDPQGDINSAYKDRSPDSNIEIEETTEVKEINGWKCRKIHYISANTELDIWMTKEIKAPNYLKWWLASPDLKDQLFILSTSLTKEFPVRIVVSKNSKLPPEATLTYTVAKLNDKEDFTYSLEGIEFSPDDNEPEVIEEINVEGRELEPSPQSNYLDLYLESPGGWESASFSDYTMFYTKYTSGLLDQNMDLASVLDFEDGAVIKISLAGDPQSESLESKMKKIIEGKLSKNSQAKVAQEITEEIAFIKPSVKAVLNFQNQNGVPMTLQLYLLDSKGKRILTQVLIEQEDQSKYEEAIYNTILTISAKN